MTQSTDSSPSRRHLLRTAAAVLGVALTAAGCVLPSRDRTPDRRDPSDADVQRLEQQMEALPGVTSAELEYFPANFNDGPQWGGVITSDRTTEAELVDTLRASWKVIWDAADLEVGSLSFQVDGPDGLSVAAPTLGMSSDPMYEDLAEWFGPRPSPTPSAS